MNITALFNTFSNHLLPIMLIAGAGFLLGKYLSVEARTVGRLSMYIFMPALAFNLLTTSRLSAAEIGVTMLLAALMIVSIALLAWLAARLMRFDHRATLSLVIAAMFANNGNYGIPLVTFAFGPAAAAFAGIYFVTSSILFNTLGVVIASLGSLNLRQALLGIFKIPMLYGILVAVLVNSLEIPLPGGVGNAINYLAAGALPLMLVLLGIELSRVQWSQNLPAIGLGAGLRLMAGPALGLALAALFGLPDLARQAVIPQTAMPSAVANTVLASEFDIDSSIVTATVFISTLLSPLTLTPLLVLLGSGQ